MRKRTAFAVALVALVVLFPHVLRVSATSEAPYQAGFNMWRAADNGFAAWTLSGVKRASDGALQFDAAAAVAGTDPYPAGGYYGHDFYNGGGYFVGEATSPEITTTFGFAEAVASWNADTTGGTWIETLLRAKVGTRWTKWYSMGVWAASNDTVERHSVSSQGDADGSVSVDTLVLSKKIVGEAYQVTVRLFSADGVATPIVRNIGVTFSSTAAKKTTTSAGDPARWNTLLNVPECSQMVYPDGGNVWCSPTSTSMVLGYWGIDPGACEPRVRAAVAGTFDWHYGGNGNWPFNTAYAASRGLEAYVVRFTSLADVERWVAAGVPVVFSFAWGKNDLTGAAVASSSGHLSVIVGFDSEGNPIVNDPAAAANEDVQRTYLRSELEALWLTNSGGLVYLIYPAGYSVPSVF